MDGNGSVSVTYGQLAKTNEEEPEAEWWKTRKSKKDGWVNLFVLRRKESLEVTWRNIFVKAGVLKDRKVF